MMRFTSERFASRTMSTIGLGMCSKEMVVDGKDIHFTVYDSSGVERFDDITVIVFRQATAIVTLVYNITREETFYNSITKWTKKTKTHAPANVIKMIVGNKCDLEESRAVSRERGQLVADDNRALFFEVSAKSGHNVKETFVTLAREYVNSME